MPDLAIPTTLEELTSDWLNRALRERGVLRDAQVTSLRVEVLGAGEGFMGEVARLHPDYDRPEQGAPTTLIAKIPTTVGDNRSIGELIGAYEREIYFYDTIAPHLPIDTPRSYFSAMDAGPGSDKDAKGAAMLDPLPMWLIRLVMRLVTWIVSRRKRRYVLLISDLEPGRVGDQVAGCTQEEAAQILSAIAKVHAKYWSSPRLDESAWLRRQDLNPRTMQCIFLGNLAIFKERLAAGAPESLEPSLRWLEARAVELLKTFHVSSPETLLHGDMRLDNVSFKPAQGSEPQGVVLFDWQLAGRGPGAYDVAYFLSGALEVDAPAEVAVDLVRGYHDELVAQGIDDYPLEDCLRDYRRGLLAVLHRVCSTGTMELRDERAFRLFSMWLERALARLQGVDYDSLLST
ncbi:MAG: phosphotransferase [bacterium]|nr:phosphotransferase [bacterium]